MSLFIDCEGNQWVPKNLLEIHHVKDCLSMSTVKCPLGSQSYCSAISIFLTLTPRHPSLSQASRNNSWFLFAKLDWTMAFSSQNLSCSAWRKNCFVLYYCFKSIKTLLYVDNNLHSRTTEHFSLIYYVWQCLWYQENDHSCSFSQLLIKSRYLLMVLPQIWFQSPAMSQQGTPSSAFGKLPTSDEWKTLSTNQE